MDETAAARDTIYALSSAPGRAGVAVVRISGPRAGLALRALSPESDPPPPRLASLRKLVDEDGGPIDQALVLWFPAPASFTGEDVAELHIHGGRAVLAALLERLGRLAGLRLAEPGEFTRRAVESGKFDLTQAEALADLIDAETESQRKQALRQYGGALGKLYEGWRERLIRASAWAEAAIDFSEEEIPPSLAQQTTAEVDRLGAEIRGHLADFHRGEVIREGIFLTLIGPPNSGKSSLLNAVTKREAAIVSATPGTTRDVVEVRLDLGGYAVTLADTAGLRDAAEEIEAEGVRRALTRAEESDLVLLVLDGSLAEPRAGLPAGIAATMTVWNKADLPWPTARDGIVVSARTGRGIDELLEHILALVREKLDSRGEAPVLTRARHRQHLAAALTFLERSVAAQEPELVAEELRLASRELGRITGRVDVEDLLEVIFRDFCIGK